MSLQNRNRFAAAETETVALETVVGDHIHFELPNQWGIAP